MNIIKPIQVANSFVVVSIMLSYSTKLEVLLIFMQEKDSLNTLNKTKK